MLKEVLNPLYENINELKEQVKDLSNKQNDIRNSQYDNKFYDLTYQTNEMNNLKNSSLNKKKGFQVPKPINKIEQPQNKENKNGDTALHLAFKIGNYDIIQLLLEHGASIKIKNKKGISPFDLADKDMRTTFNLVEIYNNPNEY